MCGGPQHLTITPEFGVHNRIQLKQMDLESELLDSRWRRFIPGIFWAVFAMGLLVQVFSPHLKIKNHAFVMPPSLLAPGKIISPAEIIAKERIIQSLSAVLTLAGALGLARCYWQRLFGDRRPRSSA
jgi:hypothetical protein